MTKKKPRSVPDSVLWQDPFDDDFRLGGQTFDEALRQVGGDPDDVDAAEEFMYEWSALWSEAIAAEPVMGALYLIAHRHEGGVWVGTEAELLEEIKDATSPVHHETGLFPSSPEELLQHMRDVMELSDAFRVGDFGYVDWRTCTQDDRDDLHLPGWGPAAPLAVSA